MNVQFKSKHLVVGYLNVKNRKRILKKLDKEHPEWFEFFTFEVELFITSKDSEFCGKKLLPFLLANLPPDEKLGIVGGDFEFMIQRDHPFDSLFDVDYSPYKMHFKSKEIEMNISSDGVKEHSLIRFCLDSRNYDFEETCSFTNLSQFSEILATEIYGQLPYEYFPVQKSEIEENFKGSIEEWFNENSLE